MKPVYLLLKISCAFFALSVATCLQADATNGYYVTGFDYYAHKDYLDSIRYLQLAIQQDPQNWKAWQTLGFDYYLSNQPLLALPAFDQSLKWHSDNPQLWNLAEGIRAKMIWEAERNDPYPRVFRNPDYGIWVSLRPGVIISSLGGLPKSAPAFEAEYGSLYGHASASCGGFGPLATLEVGFMLDTLDAWGIVFDGAALNGYQALAQDNFGNTLKGSIQPNMISIQPEYYRFFKLGRTRLWACAGAGAYLTVVELSYLQNGKNAQSGELGGLGYGGFLGLGWEFALGDQISAGIYVRGRYATTGDIEGDVSYGQGAAQLSVLGSDSEGLVSAYPVGTGGIKTTNIDYTGADGGFSISYHY